MKSASIEQERKRIEGITAERKTMEAKLRAVQSQLEEELASERDTNQRLIEQNNIQLNKAKLLSSSLDKRCKVELLSWLVVRWSCCSICRLSKPVCCCMLINWMRGVTCSSMSSP